MESLNEITALADRYGAPLRWSRAFDVTPAMLERWRDKRRAEIVLAIARPNASVLLHTKSFYPNETYRLPTGNIKFGEPIEDAAQRELCEETRLDARLTRFLGVIEYEFRFAGNQVDFVSYIFLTDETRDEPRVMDASERITGFRTVAWRDLVSIADALENLPDNWRDWGCFRAVAHRLVAQSNL